MSAALSPGRRTRSLAWVCGLAAGAIACAAPAPTRERALIDLADRWAPRDSIASASPASGSAASTLPASASSARTASASSWPASSSPTSAPTTDAAALFAGETQLERGRLVALVLERNPNLAAAHQAFRAALARPAQARSLDDPMLGVGAAPLSFGSRKVDPAGRIDLAQRLPFPGKLRLRGEAALAEAEAAGGDLESLRLELALAASKLYADHHLAARALAINREHVAVLEDLHSVALARYAAGEDSKASALSAELALARALYAQDALATEARLVVARLNALLHRPAELPLPPAAASDRFQTFEAVVEAPHESTLDTTALAGPDTTTHAALTPAPDDAPPARPELLAARAREQAALARVALARREFLPDVTLVGAYDRLWQESPLAPFVGVQLNVPLQRGRRRAALDESMALLDASRHQREGLEDALRLALESARQELAQAYQAERLVRDRLLPAAQDQVATARTAYAAGSGAFRELLAALGELHEIELAHAETTTRIDQKQAELERALGRVPGLRGERR